jgi:crotonobetainyl-CoA:carnitine CoA-transferase CaiB-like acyl-CoA transferase
MRTRPPLRSGASTLFGQLNAGKKSVVLDLKLPAAAAAIRTLAAGADILVENSRPGAMQRLAIDYTALAPLNPRLTFTLSELQGAQFEVPPPGRPIFGPLQCADGYLMVAVASEKTFQGFAQAAGHAEWITDPRFAAYTDRRANWGELMDLAEQWSLRLSKAECQVQFDRGGVPCSPYRTVAEAMADPQIAHREALTEVRDAGGTFKVLNPPFRLSAADTRAAPHAAALGEHTRAVLREAGLGDAEIDHLTLTGA